MLGDGGDDTMWGQDGKDMMSGGDGNDDMYGELGDDTMLGDNGDDAMLGDRGGIVDKMMDGSTQFSASLNSPPQETYTAFRAGTLDHRIDLLHDIDGDAFVGSSTAAPMAHAGLTEGGDDRIRGGNGNDNIHAGFGDDLANGDSGGDIVFGDDGADVALSTRPPSRPTATSMARSTPRLGGRTTGSSITCSAAPAVRRRRRSKARSGPT
jgi:Ca2+-binding RTX toxin-like protein